MANDAVHVPVPPRGINHLVLNVKDIEVSHRFWTEILGFKCVAALKPIPGRVRPKMRFYSGVAANGDVTHHDLALAEVPKTDGPSGGNGGERDAWSLMRREIGMNHVAIAWPDRESWLKQLEFLQSKGVAFHRRVNHGMTHSVYISDPDGHGIEVLYELPREVWEGDIDGAQNFAEQLPTEGPEALIDRTDNPVFDGAPAAART
jgi:catechol-2,3-dioxygenase